MKEIEMTDRVERPWRKQWKEYEEKRFGAGKSDSIKDALFAEMMEHIGMQFASVRAGVEKIEAALRTYSDLIASEEGAVADDSSMCTPLPIELKCVCLGRCNIEAAYRCSGIDPDAVEGLGSFIIGGVRRGKDQRNYLVIDVSPAFLKLHADRLQQFRMSRKSGQGQPLLGSSTSEGREDQITLDELTRYRQWLHDQG